MEERELKNGSCRVRIGEIEIEGDADFVKSIFKKVIEAAREILSPENSNTAPDTDPKKNSQALNKATDPTEPGTLSEGEVRKLIREFLEEYDIKKRNEAAVIIAYHLNKYLNKKEISPEDLKKFWDNKVKPPKGFVQLLRDTSKKQWFEKAGRNTYQISPLGIHFVEEELKRKLAGK